MNRVFSTGSRRDSRKGKGRYDLISPIALRLLALHCEEGADKYGDRNWERGQPLSVYYDSAARHTMKVLAGCTDEDHARAAFWNWMAFLHTREMIRAGKLPAELDDLPKGYVWPAAVPPVKTPARERRCAPRVPDSARPRARALAQASSSTSRAKPARAGGTRTKTASSDGLASAGTASRSRSARTSTRGSGKGRPKSTSARSRAAGASSR